MQHYQVIKVLTSQGRTLDAFEGDSITAEIQTKGEYDANTLDSIREILDIIRPDTSLDVGANIGNHTVTIAGLSRHLIAFEPVPFIFELLQRNIEQNGLANAIPVNAGLSDEAQDRDIFIPNYGNLGCSSLEAMEAEGVRVQIKTLVGDQYLREHHPDKRVDFIKIDVEGHEPAALGGLRGIIREHQPLILMEYRNQNTLNLFQDTGLFEQLFAGYQIHSLSNTANKKVHPAGFRGFLARMLAKGFNRHWCFSSFDRRRRYSNIYLVPEHFREIFRQFPYLEAK